MSCGCGGGNSDFLDTDKYVAVSETDVPGYLAPKLAAGTGVTIVPGGVPGAEFLIISAECCEQEDKFVAVANGCTPGYLQNQIIPKPGSAITVDVVDCKVRIGLDEIALQELDRYVAVDGSCDSGFLEGQIVGSTSTTGIGSGINVDKVACTLQVTIDEAAERWQRHGAALKLDTSILFTVTSGGNGFVNSNGFSSGSISPSIIGPWIADPDSTPGLITVPGVITIDKKGPWMVGFGGNADYNRGVQAIRYFLDCGSAQFLKLDQKHSGGNILTGPNPGNPTGGNGDGSGLNGEFGGTVGFGQSGVYYLDVGDTVFLSIRIDAAVDSSVSGGADGLVRVLGQNGSTYTPDVSGSGQTGTFFYAIYVGDIV